MSFERLKNSPIEASANELVHTVTRKKNGDPLPFNSLVDRFTELDPEQQETLINDPEFISVIAKNLIADRGTEGQVASAMQINDRLERLPDELQRVIVTSESFFDASVRSVLRTGNSIISIQRIRDHIELFPEEIRSNILHDPRIIEGMILYLVEPGKPIRNRLESVPPELLEEISGDARVKQALNR